LVITYQASREKDYINLSVIYEMKIKKLIYKL